MLKSAVIAHYEGSPIKVARALGITRSAVNQWPDIVPLKSALRLQALNPGKLTVDMSVYELPALPIKPLRQSASA